MNTIKPWAHGTYELIQTADTHFTHGTDVDKRNALIGYDNAIEVSIEVYLNLHPSGRAGKSYEKEKVKQWLSNYHTKMDFFYDEFLSKSGLPVQVRKEDIIWYHTLRNELYHSGNGFTPETKHIENIRKAAIWIFTSLYEEDAESLFNLKHEIGRSDRVLESLEVSKNRSSGNGSIGDDRAEFLRELVNRLKKERSGLVTTQTLPNNPYWSFGSGRSGFNFGWAFRPNGTLINELYIGADRAKVALKALEEQKWVIEKEVGTPLIWDFMKGKSL